MQQETFKEFIATLLFFGIPFVLAVISFIYD